MLVRLVRYPYGNVLARAMAARFESPAEVIDQVGSQPLEEIRDELFPKELEGEVSVVQKWHRELHRMGQRIADSLPAAPGELILTYLKRSCFENLKLVCRFILRGEKTPPPASLFLPVPADSWLPMAKLFQISSMEELASILPRGQLRDLVRRGCDRSIPHGLFQMETAMDQHFWETVRVAAGRLSPFDRAAAEEILGARADIDRLGLISRGFRSGCDEMTILGGLPDMGTIFPRGKIRRALRSKDPRAALISLYPIPAVGDPLGRAGETGLLHRLWKMLREILRSHPFDVSIPLAVVLLKELDILQSQVVRAGFLLGLEREELVLWAKETGE